MVAYPWLKESFSRVLLIVQISFLCTPTNAAPGDVTVALLPFRMHAEENIAYLGNGVRDMIVSRLSYAAPVTFIEQSLVDDQLSTISSAPERTTEGLMELGSAVEADYVIAGTIAKMGSEVSIDLTIFNLAGGGTASAVFAQNIALDQLIPHMTVLTQQIADTISPAADVASEETTAAQPPAGSESGYEEQLQGTDQLDGTTPYPGDSQHEEEAAIDRPLAADEGAAGDENPNAVQTDVSSSGGLKERLLRRESEINGLEENPAYQKSIDDLGSASEASEAQSSNE